MVAVMDDGCRAAAEWRQKTRRLREPTSVPRPLQLQSTKIHKCGENGMWDTRSTAKPAPTSKTAAVTIPPRAIVKPQLNN
jgi:hypothetical protein